MLETQPKEINADVSDALGELTNMIAGVAKTQLEHL
jgi:CheY-specific phosphatase CheX